MGEEKKGKKEWITGVHHDIFWLLNLYKILN